MQQNLKSLDDLQIRMDRLITESDSLVQEMNDLEVSICLISTSLEQINQAIFLCLE